MSAFDAAHPLGFFTGDSEPSLAIAHWMVRLIARQIAESNDPLRQQDAMIVLGELKPA